jgi:nucleoside-diphosphate-sugar epimerase
MAEHYLGAGLVRRALARDFSPLNGHQSSRDFLHAADVVAALSALATECANGHEFPRPLHLCSGTGLTVGELAIRVFAHFGVDIPPDAPLFSDRAAPPNHLIGIPSPELGSLFERRGLL